MITITAPDGLGEIGPDTDLAQAVAAACAAAGGLQDGDIVVITSKIISKHEAMTTPAEDRIALIDAETVRTVARRKSMAIVETRHGLIQAAAGVDNSNVSPEVVLALPVDPDASAARLRDGLQQLTGRRLGVVVSDTAGRAWRLGQTDHAIGAAGVLVLDSYDGRTDAYGNELHVTMIAMADQLAGAADLVKRKLTGRPVAIIRGLPELVLDPAETQLPSTARALLRPGQEDLFRMGVRESVIHALLTALGAPERYETAVRADDPAELRRIVLDGLHPEPDPAACRLAESVLATLD